MKKILLTCGIVGTILYISAIIIGGFLVPNYSHLHQSINELIPLSEGATYITLEVLFTVYNVCIILFGLGAFIINTKKIDKFWSILLMFCGLFGLLMCFFPMDKANSEETVQGIINMVITGFLSPIIVLTPFLIGIITRDRNKPYAIYSIISSIIIFITGFFSSISIPMNIGFLGLFERLTMGTFIIWVFVSSIFLIKTYNNISKNIM